MTGDPRTVGEILHESAEVLGNRLEPRLLLCHVLAVEPTEIHTHPERVLTPGEVSELRALVERRERGEPVAYLMGEWEFYGLPMRVDRRVLVPRPETELLVDEVKAIGVDHCRVLDVGTGSGCVAIAIAHELTNVEVVATDVSPGALEVARENANLSGVRVAFVETDLVAGVSGTFDVIVSNPPYIADGDPDVEPGVWEFEPELALLDVHDGDGLGFYRRLATEVVPLLRPGGTILVEVGETQARDVSDLFHSSGLEVHTRKDLAGIDRVVRGVLRD